MLKIGDFSKLSRVSIRMLRHYDEIGLLVPASTDPFTGYRYYSESQLPTAGRIAALREKYAATTSQVLAGFFFTRDCPMLPLFGCSSEEHLAELIAAVDIPFIPEDYRLPGDE